MASEPFYGSFTSSPVSNPHLILHSQTTLQVKSPLSCKTNLYINSIKVLTNGRHRSTVRKYKGLNRQSLVQSQYLWMLSSGCLVVMTGVMKCCWNEMLFNQMN